MPDSDRFSALFRSYVRSNKLTSLGAFFLIFLVAICIFGPLLVAVGPNEIGAGRRLSPPSSEFLLGTDELGRAVLPRVIDALQNTFLLSSIAVIITGIVGTMLGLLAAYLSGIFDTILMRMVDVLFAFPPLLLGVLISTIIGGGSYAAIMAIALITLPLFVRVVRSVGLSVAERGFVIAAEVSGVGTLRIVTIHLLPNIMGAVIIQLSYALSIGLLIESELSFLGLGTQPPNASLGSLLFQGSSYLLYAPWLVFPAGIVLTTAIFSINICGDGLRDFIDPLKGHSLS